MRLIESILNDAASIAAVRRDIHAHPEPCFEEQRTPDLIARTLAGWGIPTHRGLGRTGVVGVVRNGNSTRCRRPARWCRRSRTSSRATGTRSTPA